MAKGKKTSTQDKAKVISAKIKNIDKTIKQIEKETGVSNSVVSTILRDNLGKLREESQVIADIIDWDKTIVELWWIIEQQHFFNIISKLAQWQELESGEVKQLAEIREKAWRRYTLFAWEITDSKWGLKDIKAIDKLNGLLWWE